MATEKDFEGVDLACQRGDCRDLAVDLIEGEPLCLYHFKEEIHKEGIQSRNKEIAGKLKEIGDRAEKEELALAKSIPRYGEYKYWQGVRTAVQSISAFLNSEALRDKVEGKTK